MQNFFHPPKFTERKRKHFDFAVTSRKFCDKLSAKQIRVGIGNKYRAISVLAKCIDYFFEFDCVLNFIDKNIFERTIRYGFRYNSFKLLGRFNRFVLASVEIDIHNIFFIDASFFQISNYG